jgi:hypothetical protein
MRFKRIRESLALRVGLCALIGALLTLAVLFTAAPPAEAYEYLWSRYDPNSIDPIQYRFFDNCDSSWITAFKDGEAAWDSVDVPGYFQEHSWSFDPEIEVRSGDFGSDFIGATSCVDDNQDGYWDGNENRIWFNTDYNWLTAFEKKVVAEHELGHAYGLAHEDDICTLMCTYAEDVFSCATGTPGSDEIDGVNWIY